MQGRSLDHCHMLHASMGKVAMSLWIDKDMHHFCALVQSIVFGPSDDPLQIPLKEARGPYQGPIGNPLSNKSRLEAPAPMSAIQMLIEFNITEGMPGFAFKNHRGLTVGAAKYRPSTKSLEIERDPVVCPVHGLYMSDGQKP